jgi:hypothetical protein
MANYNNLSQSFEYLGVDLLPFDIFHDFFKIGRIESFEDKFRDIGWSPAGSDN